MLKNNIRIKFLFILSILLIFNIKKVCFGISDKFQFVIDTIGIPRYNIYGEEINEDVYYIYNVFSYSTPENMYNITTSQRFKEVPNLGKWTSGAKRGEYYLLGRGYSGGTIANVYFPVDGTPETTPDKWNYITVANAYNSWNDTSKYKYSLQLEYMKNTNLLFDTIDYSTNTCNSYNLIEYDISASRIGLDKVVLNTCSTWKTGGVVTINRINNKGEVRYATLATKPMAANAEVKSSFSGNSTIILHEKEQLKGIYFTFGAEAINLTDYATKEQIKEIKSIIYIDGVKKGEISGTKTTKVDKKISYVVSRTKFSTPGKHTLHIKVVSYLYTEFSVDGLMEDVYEKDIVVDVYEKLIVPINKNNINLYVQKKQNNNLVISPLVQTNETNKYFSLGFVEKGRAVALKLGLNDGVTALDNISVSINGQKVDSQILYKNNKSYIIGFDILDNLDVTLATWNYLRNSTKNYLNIDFKDVGKRVNKPYEIIVSYFVNGRNFEERILFDTIDDYMKNINFIFENGVVNKESIDNTYTLESVANE